MRVRAIFAGAVFAIGVALPSIAAAATGYATANVNLRAGPGTQYPVATTVAAGAPVQVFGCLSNFSWCDIAYRGVRGWVSGRYLEQSYAGRRVLVPSYARQTGVPVISFSFGHYWDDHYRGRSFYRDRDRWDGRRGDRREARRDRDGDRDEARRGRGGDRDERRGEFRRGDRR